MKKSGHETSIRAHDFLSQEHDYCVSVKLVPGIVHFCPHFQFSALQVPLAMCEMLHNDMCKTTGRHRAI